MKLTKSSNELRGRNLNTDDVRNLKNIYSPKQVDRIVEMKNETAKLSKPKKTIADSFDQRLKSKK